MGSGRGHIRASGSQRHRDRMRREMGGKKEPELFHPFLDDDGEDDWEETRDHRSDKAVNPYLDGGAGQLSDDDMEEEYRFRRQYAASQRRSAGGHSRRGARRSSAAMPPVAKPESEPPIINPMLDDTDDDELEAPLHTHRRRRQDTAQSASGDTAQSSQDAGQAAQDTSQDVEVPELDIEMPFTAPDAEYAEGTEHTEGAEYSELSEYSDEYTESPELSEYSEGTEYTEYSEHSDGVEYSESSEEYAEYPDEYSEYAVDDGGGDAGEGDAGEELDAESVVDAWGAADPSEDDEVFSPAVEDLWGEDEGAAAPVDDQDLSDDEVFSPVDDGTEWYDEVDGFSAEEDVDESFMEERGEFQIGQSVFDGFDVNAILADAIDYGASDIHISPSKGVFFTYLGDIRFMEEYPIPDGRVTQAVLDYIATNIASQRFIRDQELDTSFVLREDTVRRDQGVEQRHVGRRFRVSFGREFDDVFIVLRVISDNIPSPESLGIEDDLLKIVHASAGLVMVNGETGAGKSTTLASLLREVQLRRPSKIITIEKPVEYVYPNDGRALVTQREVGRDTYSFERALTSAMRQAPDVILLGEVRDREEMSELLRAAETGHLAISTMHTKNVATTISRIMGLFQVDDQKRVLLSLADSLQTMVNQVLMKSADGKSRFAVRELLTINNEIRGYIAEGDVTAIRDYQIRHEITMEHELVRAAFSGRCLVETARANAVNLEEFDALFSERVSSEGEGSLVYEDDL